MAVSEAGIPVRIRGNWVWSGVEGAKSVEGTFCRVSSGQPEAFTPRSFATDPYFIAATHSADNDRLTRELSIGGYSGASKCLFIWMQHGVGQRETGPIFQPLLQYRWLLFACPFAIRALMKLKWSY